MMFQRSCYRRQVRRLRIEYKDHSPFVAQEIHLQHGYMRHRRDSRRRHGHLFRGEILLFLGGGLRKRSRLAQKILILLIDMRRTSVRTMISVKRFIRGFRQWPAHLKTYEQRNLEEWRYWRTRRASRESEGCDDAATYRRQESTRGPGKTGADRRTPKSAAKNKNIKHDMWTI